MSTWSTSSTSTATYTYYPSYYDTSSTSTTAAYGWMYYPRTRGRTYKKPRKSRPSRSEWKPLTTPEKPKVGVDVNINIDMREVVPDKPRTRIEEVDGRLVKRIIRCENCNAPQKEEEIKEACPYCGY